MKSIRYLYRLISKLLVPAIVWSIIVIPVLICISFIAYFIGYEGRGLWFVGCLWGFFVTLVMHKVGIF